MLRPKQYVSKSPQRFRKLTRANTQRSRSGWAYFRNFMLGAFLLVVDSALLGWVFFKLWGIVETDPDFAIRNINIIGVKSFSADEIIKRSRLEQGRNIFKADIHEAKQILEAEPLFKHIDVWRQLPREILIKVVEREPLAQIVSLKKLNDEPKISTSGNDHSQIQHEDEVFPAEEAWLVDEEGVLLSERIRPSNLYPIIAMEVEKNVFHQGIRLSDEGLSRALKVLDIFSGSVLKKMLDLELIEIKDNSDVILKAATGLMVHLGSEDFENRLLRLLTILEDLKKKDQDPLTIDLRFRYVPVVLREVEHHKNA